MGSWKEFFSTTTTEPRYHRGRALRYFALAVVSVGTAVVAFLLGAADALGVVLASLLAGFFLLLGGYHRWRARRSRAENLVFFDLATAPPPLQLAYYRRMMPLTVVAFSVLTALTAWDLHQLETGQVERIRLVVPLNLIYEQFGFWSTVLSIPALGLLCLLGFRWAIKKAHRKEEEEARQQEEAKRD